MSLATHGFDLPIMRLWYFACLTVIFLRLILRILPSMAVKEVIKWHYQTNP